LFSVRVLDKSYQNPLVLPDVTFTAKSYSFSAIGGPKAADIEVSGIERGLWELLEWLRCPVEIYDDEMKEPVWWGYLHSVDICVGNFRVGVSLDEMYNRLAAVYSYVPPGTNTVGTRATTAWIQNDDSVGYYGTKELLVSLSGSMTQAAEAKRNEVLEAKYKPRIAFDFGQGGQVNTGKIRCKGWWNTLSWKYYSQISGKENCEDGTGTQNLGDAGANEQIAQSFVIASATGYDLASIKIRVRKIGAPVDNLVVSLYTNSSGNPGSLLTSKTLPAASIGATADWVDFGFDPLGGGGYQELLPATTYWVVVNRSGSVDGSNYYQVDVNESLPYTSGSMKIWGGSSWGARIPDADMAFQVLGGEETTKQIQNIITTCGQFISGVTIDSRSNLITNQYRRGDNTALDELEELLETGVRGGRRLLVRVTDQREVIVKEEPAQSTSNVEFYLKRDGSIESIWDNPYIAQTCPVGCWGMLKDVLPSSLDLGRLADPTLFFVEEATYDIARKKYTPTPKGQPGVWDIVSRIVEG